MIAIFFRKKLMQVIILALVAGIIMAVLWQGAIKGAPTAGTLSLSTTVAGEGNDFSTQVLGMPWDLSADPYPDYASVFQNFNRNTFSTANGAWTISQSTSDPNIILLNPSIAQSQKVLKMGDLYQIDAAKYRLFSFRMCANGSGFNGDWANLYWYLTQFNETSAPTIGSGNLFYVFPGCRTYVVDIPNNGTSNGTPWAGQLYGFRVDPVNFVNGVTFTFDWFRLTTEDLSNVVPISYSGLSSSSNLYFYANTSCSTTNATLIGIKNNAGTDGTFSWGSSVQSDPNARGNGTYNASLALLLPLPESMQPGQYTIFALANNTGTPICTGTPLEIRKAPIVSIQKPSMTSGPDYSTQVVGNSWDMSDPGDVTYMNDISNPSFNGLFEGIAGVSDPEFHLNVSAPIDTSKYHYVTFRMKLDAQAPPIPGAFVTVQRFMWWYTSPSADVVTTDDMIIREGWQTYSLDLRSAYIDPSTAGRSWSGLPKVFRFDISESSNPIPFHIDYVTLTGDEDIPSGAVFPILYQLNSGSNVQLTFYYDTDRNPANGRTRIANNSSQPPAGPYRIYIPLTMKGYPSSQSTAGTYPWITSGVPAGTYYISVDANDGVNTTTWYSDIPVHVH